MLSLERNIHKFPILDDNVKLLEDNSSVTNDSTMIHQAFTICLLQLEYHCAIIGTKYSQVSNIKCKTIRRQFFSKLLRKGTKIS